jgi:acyl transferase domain-containing protein
MAQVRLPAEEVRRALHTMGSAALVAAVNGPRTTVITGSPDAVEAAVVALEQSGVQCRRLNINVAGHSEPMGALGDELAKESSSWLRPLQAGTPLISTLSGARVSGAQLDGAYWGRQLRQPVAFAEAFGAAMEEGAGLVVEVSPHPLLQEPMLEAVEGLGRPVDLVPTLRKQIDEPTAMLEAVGAAWARGAPVRWDAVFPGPVQHVDLPTYRFERQPLWLPPAPPERAAASAHPLLGDPVPVAARPGEWVFSTAVSLEELPYLADHQVQGSAVMPAAAYVEMAVQAAGAALGQGPVEVRDLELRRPLVLEKAQPASLQLWLTVKADRRAEFQIHARAGTGSAWSAVAQGTVRAGP